MKKLVLLCLALATSVMPAMAKWVKCDISELVATDVVVIVDQTSGTAMSNDNGTSSAPSAIPVTFNEGKTELTGDIADNIKWNFVYQTNSKTYIIYPNAITNKWLYSTNTNNGVRVGTDSNKYFSFDSKFLKEYNIKRYIGVYRNKNWRCYETKTDDEIKATVTTFYKYEADVITAVEEVEAEVNTPVEYYNLQGVKVANPKNGIFIKKQGCRASKVIM